MLITDYLDIDCIFVDLKPGSKNELISRLAEAQFSKHSGINRDEAIAGLQEREAVLSTGIGKEIAIPHARLESSSEITVSFGLVREGADFNAIDKLPVKIIFLIFFPAEEINLQLRFLARISRLLSHTALKEDLLACHTAREVIGAFSRYESQHFH